MPGSSQVQTRGRHVLWEGKRDGGGDEQVHACAYNFIVRAEPITSLLSSAWNSLSRLVVLRAKDGAPLCAGPIAGFQPIMGRRGMERATERKSDRQTRGRRPSAASLAGHTSRESPWPLALPYVLGIPFGLSVLGKQCQVGQDSMALVVFFSFVICYPWPIFCRPARDRGPWCGKSLVARTTRWSLHPQASTDLHRRLFPRRRGPHGYQFW